MDGYHIICEADDDRDDGLAREIGQHLAEAYPGHPWHIRIGLGLLVVKHQKLSSKWGMAMPYGKIAHDANARKRPVVMAAGELLERAGLTRGRVIEGEFKREIEGVPGKDIVLA